LGQRAEPRRSPIFIFTTDDFWLNLHHFLYVLGRAQNKTRDSSRAAVAGAPEEMAQGLEGLAASDRDAWNGAVTWYAANLSKKDLTFDHSLAHITAALGQAADNKSLSGPPVDRELAAQLEGVAAIYRKVWWPKHHQANQAWRKAIQELVNHDGAAILAFIIHVYQMKWPDAGYPIHVSGYASWAGAYSTDGNLLVVSSLDEGTKGDYGLETIFHEAMHQWDDQVFELLDRQATLVHRTVPRDLFHALIFYTAGDATRRSVPGHVPYADKFGLWDRGMSQLKPALDEIWKPYLDGHGTRDEAFAELIRRTGSEIKPE
jgi:hypothetical protein